MLRTAVLGSRVYRAYSIKTCIVKSIMNEWLTILILILLFLICFYGCCTFSFTCTVICAVAFSWRLTGHSHLETRTTVSSVESWPPDPGVMVVFESPSLWHYCSFRFYFSKKNTEFLTRWWSHFVTSHHNVRGGVGIWHERTKLQMITYIEIMAPLHATKTLSKLSF